ncbi:hypothetical protein ACMFWY_14875 [Roseiconus sp. JC912]|uniref:hypothetical protein n=1 Tax=Roseiconus sp. JC912 TaxID=3396307 RepID=UPI003A4C63BE
MHPTKRKPEGHRNLAEHQQLSDLPFRFTAFEREQPNKLINQLVIFGGNAVAI